jgi:hypothetical protein
MVWIASKVRLMFITNFVKIGLIQRGHAHIDSMVISYEGEKKERGLIKITAENSYFMIWVQHCEIIDAYLVVCKTQALSAVVLVT